MTLPVDTKMHALVDALSCEKISSQEGALVLKAIARIGRFSDPEFDHFVLSCDESQQVLVYKLREQAKAALLALAGGKEALDAADVARKTKEELLIQEVCGNDFRHILENLSYDERINVLAHAKRLAPCCTTKIIKGSLLQAICNIPKEERQRALLQFPEMIKKASHDEALLLSLFEAVSKDSTAELVARLLALPVSVWGHIVARGNIKQCLAASKKAIPIIETMKLTNQWEILRIIDKSELYSDDVIVDTLPLIPHCTVGTVSNALQSVAAAPPEDRKRQVSFCVELLQPFTDSWCLIEDAFHISCSTIQTRVSQIVAKMKPNTPWIVLKDIKKILTNHAERADKAQQEIEKLISLYSAEDVMKAISDFGLELELNRAFTNLHV